MKARPVRIEGDQQRGFTVHVPLGRDGENEAVLDLDDYNDLVALKVYPNWQLRGGQVGARGPFGLEILVARVLTDAGAGQRVVFLDGNPLNLRRSNIGLQVWGTAVHHDRADLIEAADEFERRKLLAKESGSYHPRFGRSPHPNAKPDFIRSASELPAAQSPDKLASRRDASKPARTRRARLAARKGRYNPISTLGA